MKYLGLAAIMIAARTAMAVPSYTVEKVNVPGVAKMSYIGDDRIAVGSERLANNSFVGFVTTGSWSTTVAGPHNEAAGISRPNKIGDAVGSYTTAKGQQVLGIFHDGKYEDSNFSTSFVQLDFINDTGSILGSRLVNGVDHALLEVGGRMTDLGTLGATSFQSGFLNDKNEVATTSYALSPLGVTKFSAVVWNQGKLINLGTLGGVDASVSDIDDNGEAVGASELKGTTTQHGFTWNGSKMLDVGVLPGEQWSELTAVNDSGIAIGASGRNVIGDMGLPVVWTGSSLINVNTLLPAQSGWTINELSDINDSGEITGLGTYRGTVEPFILLPDLTTNPTAEIVAEIAAVPEPSTVAVLVTLAGATALRRRIR